MTPPTESEMALAEIAHRWTCRLNHTDGCGWGWQSWEDTRWGDDDKLFQARVRWVKDLRAGKFAQLFRDIDADADAIRRAAKDTA